MKECCNECSLSKFALKGKVRKRFNGVCGLSCECHWECGKCQQERDGVVGEAIPEHSRHCPISGQENAKSIQPTNKNI